MGWTPALGKEQPTWRSGTGFPLQINQWINIYFFVLIFPLVVCLIMYQKSCFPIQRSPVCCNATTPSPRDPGPVHRWLVRSCCPSPPLPGRGICPAAAEEVPLPCPSSVPPRALGTELSPCSSTLSLPWSSSASPGLGNRKSAVALNQC